MPTEEVELQRRVIAERTQLVSHMTRLKNRIQSILHANLMPRETGRIFSKAGRARLEALPLPPRPDREWRCATTTSSSGWPPSLLSSTAISLSERRTIRA